MVENIAATGFLFLAVIRQRKFLIDSWTQTLVTFTSFSQFIFLESEFLQQGFNFPFSIILCFNKIHQFPYDVVPMDFIILPSSHCVAIPRRSFQ